MRYGVCTTMDRYGDLCALGIDCPFYAPEA